MNPLAQIRVNVFGITQTEMAAIAAWFARVLAAPDDEAVATTVKTEVAALCRRFPLYRDSLEGVIAGQF